jgi:tetratricopeptide (TPR) repeat protein
MKESFLSGTIELDSEDALDRTSSIQRKEAQRVLSMSQEVDPNPDNDGRPIRIIGSSEWETQFHVWRLRNQRASDLEKEGQVDKAIALFQNNVCEWSELPGDYKRLSIIYEKRGDLEKALEYCELALISPACTLSPQDVVRSNFAERKRKLQEKIAKRQEREQG